MLFINPEAKFLPTEFVVTGFVLTGFVLTGLVLTGLVLTGLVLTGFQALDNRENRYQEMKGRKETIITKQPKLKNQVLGGGFFNNIIGKTKDILLSDFDDKNTY